MKALLILLTIGAFAVSCSSKDKKETMMKDTKDQAVKAVEPVKTKAEAAVSKAMEPAAGNMMKMECKLGKDARGISVDAKGTSGCVVNYTKNGETKQVGESRVGPTYCIEVAKRISTNLTTAGFSCQ